VKLEPIETPRTILRAFALEDLASFHRLGSDPEIVRHTADPGGSFRDLAHARQALLDHPLADYEKHGFGRLAVVWRESGEVIGFCGLKYLEESGEVDLGYRLLPEYWGLGIATETGRATLEFGFETLQLEEIVAFALPSNPASIRVLEKLGFSEAGRIDDDGRQAWRYRLRRPDLGPDGEM
jgi:RimJ/RimL family protein N-acetyltransferase